MGVDVNTSAVPFGDARLPDRIWRKLTISERGCWEWSGYRIPTGYGQVKDLSGRKVVFVHRLAYVELVGPIPEGLVIDHLCRVRRCVNPRHLEPVTQRENVARGETASRDYCKNGHEFDEANTKIWSGRRGRVCMACRRDANRRYKARRRLREIGGGHA